MGIFVLNIKNIVLEELQLKNIKIVIMAGGVGERFWPKSRKALPKQFLSLVGENSMLQDTVERLMPLVTIEDIYIATGEIYTELVSEQLPTLPTKNIIVEPCGKNTAACIGLAALHIQKECPDAVMVVLPSDHIIHDVENYREVIQEAVSIAEKGSNIATIGIVPLHPEVGYGYIKYSPTDSLLSAKVVERFVEKPDRATAEAYLASGDYLWNSGMFVWSVNTFLSNMKNLMSKHYEILEGITENIGKANYADVLNEEYAKLESISVDYGILEHAENIYVIPGSFGWDDVGSWNAIERLNPIDKNGNVLKGEVHVVETKNCTVDASGRLVAMVGVDDLVVVDTEDALLICHKDHTNQIKEVLATLKANKDIRL